MFHFGLRDGPNDGPLARVQELVEQTVSVRGVRRRPTTEWVTTHRLDVHDRGPEIGEELGAIAGGYSGAAIQHIQVREQCHRFSPPTPAMCNVPSTSGHQNHAVSELMTGSRRRTVAGPRRLQLETAVTEKTKEIAR